MNRRLITALIAVTALVSSSALALNPEVREVDIDVDSDHDGKIDTANTSVDDQTEMTEGGIVCFGDWTNIIMRQTLSTTQPGDENKVRLSWSNTNVLVSDSIGGSAISPDGTNGANIVYKDYFPSQLPKTNWVKGVNLSIAKCAEHFRLEALHYDAPYDPNTFDEVAITVVPKVEVTNIKFNHNTGSSASDALNIRQDYNTAFDISNGEWVKGGTNIPACYTTNKAVTIKARFTVQPASITSADILALSTDSGGSLGDVIKTNVTFSGGVSSPEYVTFQISGNTPTTIKKTTADVWQWKMENVNGTGSAACDMNTSGVHTVYTILNEPVAPWGNAWSAGNNPSNAWSDALDFVILKASCNGASTPPNALSKITYFLHNSNSVTGHGLTYDIYGGSPKYKLGPTFYLTEYMNKTEKSQELLKVVVVSKAHAT